VTRSHARPLGLGPIAVVVPAVVVLAVGLAGCGGRGQHGAPAGSTSPAAAATRSGGGAGGAPTGATATPDADTLASIEAAVDAADRLAAAGESAIAQDG